MPLQMRLHDVWRQADRQQVGAIITTRGKRSTLPAAWGSLSKKETDKNASAYFHKGGERRETGKTADWSHLRRRGGREKKSSCFWLCSIFVVSLPSSLAFEIQKAYLYYIIL